MTQQGYSMQRLLNEKGKVWACRRKDKQVLFPQETWNFLDISLHMGCLFGNFWVNRPKLLDTALGDWENTWRSDLSYLTFSWRGSEKVPNAEISVNLNKSKGSAVHWPVYYIQDYQEYQRSLTSNFIFLIFNNWSTHQEGWALRPLPILKSKSQFLNAHEPAFQPAAWAVFTCITLILVLG